MRKNFASALMLALVGLLLVAAPWADAQSTLNYREQGGDTWVVDGTLRLHGVNLGVAKGNHYHVDATNGSNSYNGKSFAVSSSSAAGPWATVAYALTQVSDYDVIWVTGDINEAVTCPYARTGVRIIGAGQHARGAQWKYTTGGSPLITANCDGLVVANIMFEAPSDSSAIKLVRSTGQTTAKANNALIVGIECWTGKYCIDFNGAPHNVQIIGIRAYNMRATGATAIVVSSAADDFPRRTVIRNSIFGGNVNHIVGAFANSFIVDNVFQAAAYQASTTSKMDLTNGQSNVVARNVMGGTYSIAGGYKAGTNDEWVGNLIAGGLTTANPS